MRLICASDCIAAILHGSKIRLTAERSNTVVATKMISTPITMQHQPNSSLLHIAHPPEAQTIRLLSSRGLRPAVPVSAHHICKLPQDFSATQTTRPAFTPTTIRLILPRQNSQTIQLPRCTRITTARMNYIRLCEIKY